MSHPSGSAPSPGALRLVLDGSARTLRPGESAVIGRDRGCEVTLADGRTSRRHAQVLVHEGRWSVVDLGSSNGTFVDGHRIPAKQPVPLGDGGSFRLGATDGAQVRVRVLPEIGDTSAAQPAGPAASRSGGSPALATSGDGPPPAPSTTAPARGVSRPAAPAGAPAGPADPTVVGGGGGPATRPAERRPPGSSQPLPQRRPSGPMIPSQPDQQHTGMVFARWTLPSGPMDSRGGERDSATVTGATPQVMPGGRASGRPGGPMTIGRGVENAIVVDDLLVSRQHVRLTPRPGGGYDVQDLGSRNGTYVNGQRIDRAVLAEGALLTVGHSRFTVRHGQLVASIDEGDVNFVANHLSFTLDGGKKLLDDISFALEGSSLLAVVGPSGAGKSTLLKALTGSQQATEGEVYYDGRDLYQNYQDLRHRIGVVPQDDVVHRQLTVQQALRYAAELRFPDDLDKHLRDERVDEVMAELDLSQHAQTRVDRLSGGQRKRTSVALELLTRPSLLFLDEPTSGLDPGLDKQVMNTLRGLADGGRTVVVITHSVANLGVCDKVLLLAPGGKVAYFGPPDGLLPFFRASDHADVFTSVARDPENAKLRFRHSPLMEEQVSAPLRSPRPAAGPPEKPPRQQSIPSQLSTLARRHLRVILADRGYTAFMLVMPFIVAGITLVVPGQYGLGSQDKTQGATTEPLQILVVLILAAIFMGTTATVRELVGERAIFLREKAVGLSSQAYLWSKLLIFGVLTLVQSAIVVLLVTMFKPPPADAIVFGSPTIELILVCWFTAFAAVSMGLLMSSFVKTSEQVMPLLVVSVLASLVLCGGLFPVNGRPVLEQVSYLMPSRWGYAGSAAVTDVRDIFTLNGQVQGDLASDPLWQHTAGYLFLSLIMLAVLGIAMALVTLWRVNREHD